MSPGSGAGTFLTLGQGGGPGQGAGPRGVTGAVEIRKRQPSKAGQSGPIWPAWRGGELERPAGGVESPHRSWARAAGGRSGAGLRGGLWGS